MNQSNSDNSRKDDPRDPRDSRDQHNNFDAQSAPYDGDHANSRTGDPLAPPPTRREGWSKPRNLLRGRQGRGSRKPVEPRYSRTPSNPRPRPPSNLRPESSPPMSSPPKSNPKPDPHSQTKGENDPTHETRRTVVTVGVILVALILGGVLVLLSLFVNIDKPKMFTSAPKREATQVLVAPDVDVQRATKVFHVNDCLTVKHDPEWKRIPEPGTDFDRIAIGIIDRTWVRFSCNNDMKFVNDFTKSLRERPGRADLEPTPFLINGQEGRFAEFVDGKDKRGFYYVQSPKRVCVGEVWGDPATYDKNIGSVRAAMTTFTCE